ncbi:MAG: ribbon-helix-helix protein, CopG family [Bifidobacterium crudilactis]|nr:ribbon-helix-helix protein, CopG family [Bifidobacterium crudilactis]
MTHKRMTGINIGVTRQLHPVKIRLDELTLEQVDLQRELDGALSRSAFIRMVLTQYLAPLARQRLGMIQERDARMAKANQDESLPPLD